MKTYVIMVSRYFPTGHKESSKPTNFVEKIKSTFDLSSNEQMKIHTIRSSYDYWLDRIKEIKKGLAVLSIRCWEGKPYRSKQIEIIRLSNKHDVGIEKLFIEDLEDFNFYIESQLGDKRGVCGLSFLSMNDGLTEESFKEWFKNYNVEKPLAIIHFTKFRYALSN